MLGGLQAMAALSETDFAHTELTQQTAVLYML